MPRANLLDLDDICKPLGLERTEMVQEDLETRPLAVQTTTIVLNSSSIHIRPAVEQPSYCTRMSKLEDSANLQITFSYNFMSNANSSEMIAFLHTKAMGKVKEGL